MTRLAVNRVKPRLDLHRLCALGVWWDRGLVLDLDQCLTIRVDFLWHKNVLASELYINSHSDPLSGGVSVGWSRSQD